MSADPFPVLLIPSVAGHRAAIAARAAAQQADMEARQRIPRSLHDRLAEWRRATASPVLRALLDEAAAAIPERQDDCPPPGWHTLENRR